MPDLSITEGAIAQHEVYLLYINAGFTAEQALELLKALIMAGA